MDAPPAAMLEATERARLRALVAGDTAAASPYHAADFELITPGGARVTKAGYLQALATGELDYRYWEPVGAVAMRRYAGGAVLRYEAQLEADFQGERLPRRRFWHTDVYEQRAGRWQVVWSQATEVR